MTRPIVFGKVSGDCNYRFDNYPTKYYRRISTKHLYFDGYCMSDPDCMSFVEGVKEDIWFELIDYGSRNERMPTLIECY